jgi:hypothetical protein
MSIGCVTAGLLLFLGLPWRADACWITLATVHVSTSFRVIVQHGSMPIPGIKVAVFDNADLEKSQGKTEWKPILTLVSGPDGAIEIQDLKPGRYLIETKGPGAGSAVNAVVSTKRAKGNNRISLEWPSSWTEILKAKTLAGTLASSNPWLPFQSIHIELWTAGAASPLAVEDTGAEGHFKFNELKSGIYVLRVRGHQQGVGDTWQVDGDIPVDLSPSSADLPGDISLHLAMSSCGITYSKCPVPKAITMTSRRIRVRDPLGAVIARAEYELEDQSGAVKAHGSTDSNGTAELPPDLLGKVTLVIASPGFTLLKQPLEMGPLDANAGDLLVSMAVQISGNECSTVVVEKHAPRK